MAIAARMDLRSLTETIKEEMRAVGKPVSRPKPDALVQACDGSSELALLVAIAYVRAERELALERRLVAA